ncbi:MAG TPA: VWA domain-containing protein [Gammaproteobacteria bacterium]|nr:VWA domain-containing protein [Gammaproteobacteria bacterium]
MKRTLTATRRPLHAAALDYARFALLLWLTTWLALPALAAEGDGGVDAVLIMDSSGSMAKNDPDRLRVPAAKMFMSLLGDGDRIGLVSFSDNGYPVLHLTAPGPKTNARILASADKVSSKGVYTNLYAALEKGLAMLDSEGREGQEKILVLMSDGKMDVGNSEEDWALTGRLKEELLPAAKQKGVKVYTIAFTEASDVDLLHDIATATDGLFKLARSDQDLHEVFSAIFESAKDPDMLPIEGGEFVVDESIEEVTIVASKEREDVRIYLQAPDGKKIGAEDAGADIKWFLSQHFDMITLRKPAPGTWKLLFTGGRNHAYIVTDMSLHHNPQQASLKPGEEMVLEAWLEENGQLLDREAVLTNTRFSMEIEAPDGATARFDLFDRGEYGDRKPADGVYANTLSYENPGSYRISLIARGETFQRQKTVHFEVSAPPVDLKAEVQKTAAAEADRATPAEAEAPGQELPAAPEEAPATESEETAPPEAAPSQPEPETQAADEGEEAAPAPKKKKKISLGAAIGIFAAVNLVLGGLGFGIWWFLKRRGKAAPAGDEQGDDKDEEKEAGAGGDDAE